MNASATETEPKRRSLDIGAFLRRTGLFWILLALCIVAGFLSPNFFKWPNLVNVSRQVALYGIVALSTTMVILTKGIDLSVGSIVGVVAVTCAGMLADGWNVPVVVASGLSIGAAMGAVNGLGITLGRVPPFIMTLGMMVVGRGLTLMISNGTPVNLGAGDGGSFSWLGSGRMLGLPVPVWIFAILALLLGFVLTRTVFGRSIYAVGSNEEAARLAGIPVQRTIFLVYVVNGVFAALTSLIFVSRLTVGDPTAGTGLELEAITIVVIGGTSLFGGEGGVFGTVVGAAIIAVLANVLNLFGISPFTQQVVKGTIIVLAVLAETLRTRRT
ncbi:ABC transporter permease [Aureimonas leprariae]|uniref:ABC transporter permease n=1 Tax=Plantimonas leprariae TaxID=2615207 RepID=A0A7V7PLJ4_9HYPH|nr:ABC transporter permease [Aureimonas leprariae]KAB0677242.1 ABC transporter permease [Aureimonas leprariae]